MGRARCVNKRIKGSGAWTGVCYGPDQLREKSIQPPRSLRGQAEKERGTVARSRFECKFNERARIEQMLSGGVCLNYSNWLIVSLSDRVQPVPLPRTKPSSDFSFCRIFPRDSTLSFV